MSWRVSSFCIKGLIKNLTEISQHFTWSCNVNEGKLSRPCSHPTLLFLNWQHLDKSQCQWPWQSTSQYLPPTSQLIQILLLSDKGLHVLDLFSHLCHFVLNWKLICFWKITAYPPKAVSASQQTDHLDVNLTTAWLSCAID